MPFTSVNMFPAERVTRVGLKVTSLSGLDKPLAQGGHLHDGRKLLSYYYNKGYLHTRMYVHEE